MEQISRQQKQVPVYVNRIMAVLGVLLLVYSGARAYTVAFTPDEIYTYRFNLTFRLYPDLYHTESANFHWLNSWLMKLISVLGGDHPFALRLPAVGAHALFLIYGAKICTQLRKPAMIICAFILLNMHPYLLDFFSLARGYGLACGFMMMGLWFTWRRWNGDQSIKALLWAEVALVLSVLANFGMLYLFITINALLVLKIVAERVQTKDQLQSLLAIGATVLLLLAVVVPHLLKMKAAGALYHGADQLWDGAIKSVVVQLLYGVPYAGTNHWASAHLSIYILCSTILVSLVLAARRQGWKTFLLSAQGYMFLLFAGLLLIYFAQHVLIGVKYPFNRTGVYLLPLFMLLLVFSFDQWHRKTTAAVVLSVLCLPVLFHFVYNANKTYVFEWRTAGNADELYEILDAQALNNPADTITVVGNAVPTICVEFYAERDCNTQLYFTQWWDTLPMPHADYYLVEDCLKLYHRRPDSTELYRDSELNTSLYFNPETIATVTAAGFLTTQSTSTNTGSAPNRSGGNIRPGDYR